MSSTKRRKAPWENKERHFCEVCNAWMGSDRQSILIHENGSKHKMNQEKAMEKRRKDKEEREKTEKLLQKSLLQMESSARKALGEDLGYFAHQNYDTATIPPPTMSSTASMPITTTTTASQIKQNKKEWEAKKKQREDEKAKKRQKQKETDEEMQQETKRIKVKIEDDQGHYTYDDKTYLEGPVFGDIIEEDMPVQIWTGSALANDAEKRLLERMVYWKDCLVVAVRKRPLAASLNERILVDVAYLKSPEDTEETIEKSVPLSRVRLILGADENIPSNLEEARILAMGGEEIETAPPKIEMDDNTGLSGWATVSIKRTTVHQELKEERERLRIKRREARAEAERQKKESETRRMEEAKLANADDSALGAYDIWNQTKHGYKGVDIHGEARVEVHDTGKKLAEGNPVDFKKSAFKAKAKRQNKRTTSADDD